MNEVVGKVGEYFSAGVDYVWVVLPQHCQIHVYDSPTSSRILDRDDELSGEPVLPGFRLSLGKLFDDLNELTGDTPAE